MKTVSFILTGPPTANVGSFVSVVDDAGQPVDVGWWEHDGAHWRYTMPVELVPRLIVPQQPELVRWYGPAGEPSSPLLLDPLIDGSQRSVGAVDARRALKDKVRNARKKEQQVTESPTDSAWGWETCPGCNLKFDPLKDELMDCGSCGESRSTACCLRNPVAPCEDCQALAAAGQENDQSDAVAPPNDRLFDGSFHGKGGGEGGSEEDED